MRYSVCLLLKRNFPTINANKFPVLRPNRKGSIFHWQHLHVSTEQDAAGAARSMLLKSGLLIYMIHYTFLTTLTFSLLNTRPAEQD